MAKGTIRLLGSLVLTLAPGGAFSVLHKLSEPLPSRILAFSILFLCRFSFVTVSQALGQLNSQGSLVALAFQ